MDLAFKQQFHSMPQGHDLLTAAERFAAGGSRVCVEFAERRDLVKVTGAFGMGALRGAEAIAETSEAQAAKMRASRPSQRGGFDSRGDEHSCR